LRALSVKNFIVSNGINPSRITTVGYGLYKPLYPNDTPENMSKNRRTEFTISSSVFLQTFNKQTEKEKYAILLNSYTSVKKATEDKKFYLKIGYKPRLVMNESDNEAPYRLYLAICTTKTEAEKIVSGFEKEYKNAKPQIISIQ